MCLYVLMCFGLRPLTCKLGLCSSYPPLTKDLNFINLLFVILRANENYGLVGVVQAEQLDLLGVVVPQHAGGQAGGQLGRLGASVQ